MRFEYDRMTGAEFEHALKMAKITHGAFARSFGVNKNVVERWLAGKQDIPVWVRPTLTMMIVGPDMRTVVRRTAATIIREDKLNPGLGNYPYRAARDLPADVEIGDD